MPKVYIAGPMRGLPDNNFPAFDRAARLLRSAGWTVISPAEMDRDAGDGNVELPHNGGDPALVRRYIRRDYEVIVNQLKAEEGDAIAVLPKWWGSVGGKAEVATGLWAKLPFFEALSQRPIEPEIVGKVFRPFTYNGEQL